MVISVEKTYQRYKDTGAGGFFFGLASFIFFLSLLAYGALYYLNSNLNKDIKDLNNQLNSIKTPQDEEIEKSVFLYKSKIQDAQTLLKNHAFPSKIFNFLEKNTHPAVQFTKFSYDSSDKTLLLEGIGESIEILAQQQKALLDSQNVKELLLSKLSSGPTGRVKFTLAIKLNEEMLK